MGSAKDLVVRPISSADARRIIKRLHYSGKIVQNSQVHLGVFMGDLCGGALQFGPSLDKRKIVGLVAGTPWNGFIELNRLALADWLPRNSESRALGVAMRMLRKSYPWLQWVISFADATQCGDGTIYRAAGFVLTDIRPNGNSWRLADGTVVHKNSVEQHSFPGQRGAFDRVAPEFMQVTRGKQSAKAYLRAKGIPFEVLAGFQLRYIYFLDPTARARLTVPEIPFSEIARRGASMYRGVARASEASSDAPAIHAGEGGAAPTLTLHSPHQTPPGKKAPAPEAEAV